MEEWQEGILCGRCESGSEKKGGSEETVEKSDRDKNKTEEQEENKEEV